MKLSSNEISYLVFLAEVVQNGNKKALFEETYQCLLYIVKSLEEVEVPDTVGEQIHTLMLKIEHVLRDENDRMREIRSALAQPKRRKPLG